MRFLGLGIMSENRRRTEGDPRKAQVLMTSPAFFLGSHAFFCDILHFFRHTMVFWLSGLLLLHCCDC